MSGQSRNAAGRDYGKPRPALVLQSDLFSELPSVVVCPLTTTLCKDTPQLRIDRPAVP